MTEGESTLKINEMKTFLHGLQTVISDIKGFLQQVEAKQIDLARIDTLQTQYQAFSADEKTALGNLGADVTYLAKLKSAATDIGNLDFTSYTHILNGTEPE